MTKAAAAVIGAMILETSSALLSEKAWSIKAEIPEARVKYAISGSPSMTSRPSLSARAASSMTAAVCFAPSLPMRR